MVHTDVFNFYPVSRGSPQSSFLPVTSLLDIKNPGSQLLGSVLHILLSFAGAGFYGRDGCSVVQRI